MLKYKKHVPLLLVTIIILSVFLFFGPNSVLSSEVTISTLNSQVIPALLLVSVIMVFWGGINLGYTKFFTDKEKSTYKNYTLIGFALFSLLIAISGVLTLHEKSFCCGPNSFDPQDFDAAVPSD